MKMYHRRGFGFGGASPPWPYVGCGRGGFPRCWYPGAGTNLPHRFSPVPYPSSVSPEQELGFLKEEANIIKKHLNDVETRVKELEGKEN
jgi:hypothetical protein